MGGGADLRGVAPYEATAGARAGRRNASTVREMSSSARAPVQNRQADRGPIVPDRAAHPRFAARLDAGEDLARHLVVREAEEHLIEHHVVQHLAPSDK